MRIDVHCHAIGKGRDFDPAGGKPYFNIDDSTGWLARRSYHAMYAVMEANLAMMEEGESVIDWRLREAL